MSGGVKSSGGQKRAGASAWWLDRHGTIFNKESRSWECQLAEVKAGRFRTPTWFS